MPGRHENLVLLFGKNTSVQGKKMFQTSLIKVREYAWNQGGDIIYMPRQQAEGAFRTLGNNL